MEPSSNKQNSYFPLLVKYFDEAFREPVVVDSPQELLAIPFKVLKTRYKETD